MMILFGHIQHAERGTTTEHNRTIIIMAIISPFTFQLCLIRQINSLVRKFNLRVPLANVRADFSGDNFGTFFVVNPFSQPMVMQTRTRCSDSNFMYAVVCVCVCVRELNLFRSV